MKLYQNKEPPLGWRDLTCQWIYCRQQVRAFDGCEEETMLRFNKTQQRWKSISVTMSLRAIALLPLTVSAPGPRELHRPVNIQTYKHTGPDTHTHSRSTSVGDSYHPIIRSEGIKSAPCCLFITMVNEWPVVIWHNRVPRLTSAPLI